MNRRPYQFVAFAITVSFFAAGCQSYADRGTLAGGLGGAGVGAIIGHAVGNTGAGAAIGAATGMLAGNAIGSGLDDIEARNRAEIEARLGRPVAVGAVTIPDVVAMSQAGVSEELMITHIQANGGFAGVLQANDLIYLQQQGVSTRVVQALQTPAPRPVVMQAAAPVQPVVVEEYYYGPYWGPPPRRYYHRHHHHGPSFGVSISN